MKTTATLFLFIISFILTEVSAQTVKEEEKVLAFELTLASTTYKSFFLRHPSVEKFSLVYVQNRPDHLVIDFNEQGPVNTHGYDLTFDGDVYTLKRIYPQLDFNSLPSLTLRKMPLTANYNTMYMSVNKDSVSYGFYYAELSDRELRYTLIDKKLRVTEPAKYCDAIQGLADSIQLKYQNQGVRPTDSIMVFLGKIDRTGKLEELDLLVGQSSPFSELILNEFKSRSSSWCAARIRGSGPTPSYFKIYVEVNKNGSLVIKTPHRYIHFNGK